MLGGLATTGSELGLLNFFGEGLQVRWSALCCRLEIDIKCRLAGRMPVSEKPVLNKIVAKSTDEPVPQHNVKEEHGGVDQRGCRRVRRVKIAIPRQLPKVCRMGSN